MRKSGFMKRRILPLVVLTIATTAYGQAGSTPKFRQFPVKLEKARVRSIDFKKNPEAGTFRTRLSEALKGGVNFAGHYVVAGWGCGTGCLSGAIIDARTGDVYWPEQFNAMAVLFTKGEYAQPIDYRQHSRLLVLSGVPGQKDEKAAEKPSGIYFYEWKNNRLHQLRFVPKVME